MFADGALECRRRSAECKRLAEHAETEMHYLYLRMAADWDYLAHACQELESDRTWIAKARAIIQAATEGTKLVSGQAAS